jgi:hypothetical protein
MHEWREPGPTDQSGRDAQTKQVVVGGGNPDRSASVLPCANLIEHRDGDSQLFECIDAAPLAAQPLATEQVGSGELGSGAHSGQAVEQ